MKKRLGISFSETNFEYYWNWFSSRDDIEPVKLSFEDNNIEDMYTCNGFVLTGGVDIHPSLYEGCLEYNNSPAEFQPARDRFEAIIYGHSQQNSLPVFGICRGMQLVNVLEGGKLIQDLDGKGSKIHCRHENGDREHTITATTQSLLHQVTGCCYGYVNSAHHQAVDPASIGNNLVVNAINHLDGSTIEGLEFADKTGKGFMLCVQWHPERMKDKDENPFSQKLKTHFPRATLFSPSPR